MKICNIIWRHNKFCNQKNIMGKFIVFEGLDRSGKSSMTKLAQTTLNKTNETMQIGFPNRTSKIGSMINDFLMNKVELPNQAIHLLFSANRWENMKQIEQQLKKGNNVVCDRYWYSGVAYSYAKGMGFEWCIKSDEGLIQPDLVIFLKGDPQTLASREGYGQQRFEKVQFQIKVNEGFEKLMKKLNKPYIKTVEVNGKNLNEIGNQVLKLIDETLSVNPQ